MEELEERLDEYGGLAEAIIDKKQILRRFKSKNIAAIDWIKDLVVNGYRKKEKGGRRRANALEEGFFMSDEMSDIGILSIAPSLSALLSELTLLRKKGETDPEPGETFFIDAITDNITDNKIKVLDVVMKSIGKLIAECYPDGLSDYEDQVLFSSAPFYEGVTAGNRSVWENGGYLDAASWAFLVADLVEAFLNRFEEAAPDLYKKTTCDVYDEGTETLSIEETRKYVRNIYLASIRTTCDCIVKRDGRYLGWTFRKMSGDAVEPSLYFSYVASTVYLGLYKRFNGSNDVIVEMRKFEAELRKKNDSIKKYRFYDGFGNPEMLTATLDWMTRNGFPTVAEFLRGLTQKEIDELDLLYNKINGGNPLSFKTDEFDDVGSFTLLKEATVGMAEMLWKEGFGTNKNKLPFSENMAKGPCFEDGTLVDMNVVRLSSHNNAFFNNLFVIGIILNSAYDMELKSSDLDEYNRMLNIFQLSIQNTQRCYNEIEGEGLLYKIDSYILDFSDKVDNANAELAKQLRRVNMSVVPLMPLMLKNNNLMSEYVVRYPQKQMTESLKSIIRNRKADKDGGQQSWVWDKDGYNSITNYYYVDALISFYRYYEDYEEPLINNEELRLRNAKEEVEKVQKEHQRELADQERELRAEIAGLDAGIAEYRRVFKDLAKLMVNGLIDAVDEQITETKLIGSLSPEERTNRDTVIGTLNSFDKDGNDVKISSLVHLIEKLQVLSLLSMDSHEQLLALLKNGGERKYDGHINLISDVFGEGGNSSGFIRNLLIFLMNSLAVSKPDSDKTDKKD